MARLGKKNISKAPSPLITDTSVGDQKSKTEKSNDKSSEATERYNLRKAPKKVTRFDASENDGEEKSKKQSKLKIKSPFKKK